LTCQQLSFWAFTEFDSEQAYSFVFGFAVAGLTIEKSDGELREPTGRGGPSALLPSALTLAVKIGFG
jgi:hypothetical protein